MQLAFQFLRKFSEQSPSRWAETALRNILGCSILVFLKIVYMEVPNGKLEQQAPRTN